MHFTINQLKHSVIGSVLDKNSIAMSEAEWLNLQGIVNAAIKGLSDMHIEDEALIHVLGYQLNRAFRRADPSSFMFKGMSLNVFKALMTFGFDITSRSGIDQRSPLHQAAQGGNGAIVRALLNLGADANAVDSQGRLPLDEAISGKHQEIITLLLAAPYSNSSTIQGRVAVCGLSRMQQPPTPLQLSKLTSARYFLTDEGVFYYHLANKKLQPLPLGDRQTLDFLRSDPSLQPTDVLSSSQLETLSNYTNHSHAVECLIDSEQQAKEKLPAFMALTTLIFIAKVVVCVCAMALFGILAYVLIGLLLSAPLTFLACASVGAALGSLVGSLAAVLINDTNKAPSSKEAASPQEVPNTSDAPARHAFFGGVRNERDQVAQEVCAPS